MPVYAYRAITSSGGMRDARIEAASESQAKALLRKKGEQVLQIKAMAVEQTAEQSVRLKKKSSPDEVAGAIRQMSILVRAGVPLVEGLKGLAEQARSQTLKTAMEDITLSVSQGTNLSDAFSKHPALFPTLAVEMAKVAEAGGNLSEALERLADHMETGAEIGRKIKAALAYPVVVMIISVVTVIVMVTFILPRFMKLFDQMGAKLPWTTKTLMTISHATITYWYLFILGAVGIFYAVRQYKNSAAGKRKLDQIALKLPIVGDIVSKVVLNRVLASMSTLLSSGVPMVKTLETSAAAANNEIVKEALLQARKDVAEGSATSQSLKTTGVFPPLVLQMVASGEKTGELPAMLEYICTMYARETDAKVKSLTSVIEPIMIVVLGMIVGFIAMSVIVPIYSLVGGVK
ncbi:MAG: type II secretion system F family protein [Armatimonadota bacterium]|nr:type II secretion system F family protein [bacterium]